MKHSTLLLALPLFLGFAACESTPDAPEPKQAAAKSEDSEADEKKEEAAEAVAKAERDLEDARIEQKVAMAEIEAATRKGADAIASAENDLAEATAALEQFQKVEREFELSKVQLGLDRAAWGLEAERQELAELEAMYKKDDVATLTKELVLQRGKKGVEFAERNLAHEQREAATKRDFELPKKLHELEFAKREKENALREERANQARAKDELELKQRKSRASIEDGEKALAKARAKAAKAAKP